MYVLVLVHHLRHQFSVELAETVEVIRFFHRIPLFTNNSLLIQLWFSEYIRGKPQLLSCIYIEIIMLFISELPSNLRSISDFFYNKGIYLTFCDVAWHEPDRAVLHRKLEI